MCSGLGEARWQRFQCHFVKSVNKTTKQKTEADRLKGGAQLYCHSNDCRDKHMRKTPISCLVELNFLCTKLWGGDVVWEQRWKEAILHNWSTSVFFWVSHIRLYISMYEPKTAPQTSIRGKSCVQVQRARCFSSLSGNTHTLDTL